jgi:hypothetical protein
VHSRTSIVAHAPSVARASSAARVPSAAHAPKVSCVPVASIATADLCDKLERHREGEDGRITIERLCERRRNLKGDYGTPVAAPTTRATSTPSSLGAAGGCMALAPHLYMVVWPRKFWPHLPKKYGRTGNPAEFLQIYSTSILTAGGDETVMANYFPVAMTGMARSRVMNPPEGTLTSW